MLLKLSSGKEVDIDLALLSIQKLGLGGLGGYNTILLELFDDELVKEQILNSNDILLDEVYHLEGKVNGDFTLREILIFVLNRKLALVYATTDGYVVDEVTTIEPIEKYIGKSK